MDRSRLVQNLTFAIHGSVSNKLPRVIIIIDSLPKEHRLYENWNIAIPFLLRSTIRIISHPHSRVKLRTSENQSTTFLFRNTCVVFSNQRTVRPGSTFLQG